MVNNINITNEPFRRNAGQKEIGRLPDHPAPMVNQLRFPDSGLPHQNDRGRMVATDKPSNKNFYMEEDGAKTVIAFDENGEEIWFTPPLNEGHTVKSADSNGTKAVLGYTNGQVAYIDLATFAVEWYADLFEDNPLLFVDSNGKVHGGHNEYRRFDSDGNLELVFQVGNEIEDISVDDSTGEIYVATRNDVVTKFLPDGTKEWDYTGFGNEADSVVYDQNNDRVFAGSNGSQIARINVDDGNEIWKFGTSNSVRAIDVSPNGFVLAGDTNGSVYHIDPADGSHSENRSNDSNVRDVAPDPNDDNGVIVARNSGSRAIRRENVNSNDVFAEYNPDDGREVRSLITFDVNPGGPQVLSVNDKGVVRYHNPVDLVTERSPAMFGSDRKEDMEYIPSTDEVVTVSGFGGCQFFDAETGEVTDSFHRNGDTRNKIGRNLDYQQVLVPGDGFVYFYVSNRDEIDKYDPSTESFVETLIPPTETIDYDAITTSMEGGNAFFYTVSGQRIYKSDDSLNPVWSVRSRHYDGNGREIRQLLADDEHLFGMDETDMLFKYDVTDGSELFTREIDRLSNGILFRGPDEDRLIVNDDGIRTHVIKKSDFSYDFFLGPSKDQDFDTQYASPESGRIYTRDSYNNTNTCSVFQHNDGTRVLYRASLMGQDLDINGYRVDGEEVYYNPHSSSRVIEWESNRNNSLIGFIFCSLVEIHNGTVRHSIAWWI
jgi:hypothetical protein